MTEFLRSGRTISGRFALALLGLLISTLLLVACGDNSSSQATLPSCTPTTTSIAAGAATSNAAAEVPVPATVGVPASAQQVLDSVGQQTTKVRCLAFKDNVGKYFMTRDALAKYQLELFNRDNPPEQIAQAEKTLETFGFVPSNFDLAKTYNALQTEQVLGFYDPRTKKFYIIVDQQPDKVGPLAKFTAAHELTHALQDQNFDLQKVRPLRQPGATEGNDDLDYALTALIEGDAVNSQTLWVQAGNLNQQELGQIRKEASQVGQSSLNSAPLILKDTLSFPYQEGFTFVQGIFRKGGYEAVNKMFTEKPPRSTSQILHPEKYDKGIDPVKVDLPSVVDTLGSGWKSVDINTMGELQSRIWLNGILNGDQANTAVETWAGDRYQVLQDGQGRYGYVWRSQWETEKAAGGFLRAASLYNSKLYNLSGETIGPKRIWSSADKEVAAIQKGNQVLLIVLPKGSPLDKVMGKLGF